MQVTIVAALAENRTIGRDGGLPWELPDDLRHFLRLTAGHCVIMGRRTFASLDGPLPKRTNIVVSRDPAYAPPGALVAASVAAALDLARDRGESEAFVAGGGAIYAEALPLADRMVLTRVHAAFDGDAHFPEWDARGWKLVRETPHPADARHAVAFTIEDYERRS